MDKNLWGIVWNQDHNVGDPRIMNKNLKDQNKVLEVILEATKSK